MDDEPTCRTCGGPRYKRSRTGLCGQCSRRDPAVAAKKSATIRERYATDPGMRERHHAAMVRHNQSVKMREVASRKAKTLRIWELAKAAQTPETRAKAAKTLSERKMAHIPAELRDEYRALRRRGLKPMEALEPLINEYLDNWKPATDG